MEKVESLVDKLIEGRVFCNTCPYLEKLIDDVRNNRISKEEFTEIIKNSINFNENLKKVV